MNGDWKNRDEHIGASAILMWLVVIFVGFLFVRCSNAEPIVVNAELILFETAQEVNQECMNRNGQSIPRSKIPSCFTGSREHCIIITRKPDINEEDLAGAAFLAREVNNCVYGHRFATNPE